MAGEAEIFDLSKLISNRGYDFIVEAIFTNMDPPSLAKCRLVSKSLKALIDSRKSILLCQLQWLKQNKLEYPDAKVWYKLRRIVQSQRKYSIIEKFPELRQIILDLERNATGHELSIIVMFLQKYSKNQKFPIETLGWDKRMYMKAGCSINEKYPISKRTADLDIVCFVDDIARTDVAADRR